MMTETDGEEIVCENFALNWAAAVQIESTPIVKLKLRPNFQLYSLPRVFELLTGCKHNAIPWFW